MSSKCESNQPCQDDIFENVIRQLQRILRSPGFREMPPRFDISDVVQESAIQAWKHIAHHGWNENAINTAWLRSVATGHYYKLMRFHFAAKRSIAAEQPASDLLDVSIPGDPAGICETRESAILLMGSIEELDPLARRIVTLRFFDDLSFSSIATVLEVSPYRVKTCFANAMKTLRFRQE